MTSKSVPEIDVGLAQIVGADRVVMGKEVVLDAFWST